MKKEVVEGGLDISSGAGYNLGRIHLCQVDTKALIIPQTLGIQVVEAQSQSQQHEHQERTGDEK
jgi:hypothetical protein